MEKTIYLVNILYTIPSLEVGGAEIFLARLSRELLLKGAGRIFILDFESDKRDPDVLDYFPENVTFIKNPMAHDLLLRLMEKRGLLFKKERNAYIDRFYKRFLARVIKKYDIHVIHSHLYRSDRIIAKADLDIYKLTTLHGCYNSFGADRKEEMGSIFKSFDKIIYISDKNIKPLDLLDNKTEVMKKAIKMYNGIELFDHPSKPVSAVVKKIVIVSRAIKEKGWEIVIEAVKQLQREGIELELNLVGYGEQLSELKQKYSQDDRIHFIGKTMDVHSFIAEADICCFPSVYPNESFPNSIMEYMIHTKPIIANNVGEVEQMLTMNDGKKCAMIAPKDATFTGLIDFYYTTIKELLNDAVKRAEYGRMAHQNVKKFDINSTASAYLKLYDNFKK